MDITRTHLGHTAELRVQGRIDTFWSNHLKEAIDYTLNEGAKTVRLHLADVDYLSSAGIRVLLQAYKEIEAAGGRLEIVQPSKSARAILEMSGLNELIRGITEESAPAPAEEEWKEVPTQHGFFWIHELAHNSGLQCALVGNPASLRSGLFRGDDARNVLFPDSTFGLGLGAFGRNYADCRGRHGEFLALAGAAAYQPTDGTDVVDFLVSEGDWVAELNVLYALWGQGRFSQLLRFDAKPEPGHVPLTEIAQMALSSVESDTAGIVMLAESQGLLGLSLKRSLGALKSLESPLSFREIRKTLAGDPQRLSKRVLSAVVGVVSLNPPGELAPLFQPIAPGSPITGHFNAAIFPKRSLDDGVPNLQQTVQQLFLNETVTELQHLLPDEGAGEGGQSHFLRGACWAGPVNEISFGGG
jgi:anti-anti-sigma factor